ncbi:MAG: Na+/H+ antiporter subunit E [Pseudomonadota bacterium]
MNLFLLNVILALAWCAVTVSFAPVNLSIGFFLGAFAIWLLRDKWGNAKYFFRIGHIVDLASLFVFELIKSSVIVAWEVVRPRLQFEPGIVAVPLTVDRDLEIMMLANLISLTPGTLSVDVSTDRSTLYVHALHIGDADDFVRSIKDGFEKKILEALR